MLDQAMLLTPRPQPPPRGGMRARERVRVRVGVRVGVRVRVRARVSNHLDRECSSWTPPFSPPGFLSEPLYGASTHPQHSVCTLPSLGPLSHLGVGA